MKHSATNIIPLEPARPLDIPHGTVIGTIASVEPDSPPLVEYAEHAGAPVAARTTVPVSPGDAGRQAVLLFERNDPERPIIIGLLDPPASRSDPSPISTPGSIQDVLVDGERIIFQGKREIILRCGEGSIILRADGKVIIKGVRVTSRARTENAIKGGSVRIN